MCITRRMVAATLLSIGLMNGVAPGLDYPITIQRGNGLANVFSRLNAGAPVRIAYIGGSITQMTGYRDNVTAWFKSKYPGKIIEINAGWSGTGSLIGAMRFDRDVLVYKPDLVFIEFAVNDLPEDKLEFVERNAEGFIRQAWTVSRRTDICFIETIGYYTEPAYLAGHYPTPVQAHYNAADHYGCPSVNVGWALYEQVLAGTPWTDLSPDRLHPNAAGSQIYSDAIIAYLESERSRGGALTYHTVPSPMTDYPVLSGTIHDPPSPPPAGWTAHTNEMGLASFIQSDVLGATVTFAIDGPAAACKILVSPDGGNMSFAVDHGPFVSANIPTTTGAYIWAFPTAKTAGFGSHVLTLRLDSGTARIINVESANTKPVYARGDFDGDGDVDQDDFGHLQMCLTGPNAALSDAACLDADLDSTTTVDKDDITLFKACMNGPGIAPPDACR